MSRGQRATCPLDCPDACGVIVETDDERRFERLRGDPLHPWSRGGLPRAADVPEGVGIDALVAGDLADLGCGNVLYSARCDVLHPGALRGASANR